MATQSKTAYVSGLLVDEQNLNPDQESDRNAIAELFAAIIGTYNAQVSDSPVTDAVTQGSLTFTVGGANQRLFIQGRLADYIPATQFTAGAADPSQGRYDALCVKYSIAQVNGRVQTIEDTAGNQTPTQIENNLESVTWYYKMGTPGSPVPAAPAGYEIFATVYVAPNATTPVVSILFPAVSALLSAGTVISVNNISALVNILGGAGISVATQGNNIIITSTSTSGVTSINTLTGMVTIQGGPGIGVTQPSPGVISIADTLVLAGGSGISVAKSSDGTMWTITNTGASTSINGKTGTVNITAADTSILVGASGNNVTLSAPPGPGQCYMFVAPGRVTSGKTVTAPFALPSGNWQLYARVDVDLGTNVTCTLTGGGSGCNWDPGINVHDQNDIEQNTVAGTCSGGSTPSATLTYPNGDPSSNNYHGYLIMWCTRIS